MYLPQILGSVPSLNSSALNDSCQSGHVADRHSKNAFQLNSYRDWSDEVGFKKVCLPKGTSTSTLETKVDDRSVETERDYDRNYADVRVEQLLNIN